MVSGVSFLTGARGGEFGGVPKRLLDALAGDPPRLGVATGERGVAAAGERGGDPHGLTAAFVCSPAVKRWPKATFCCSCRSYTRDDCAVVPYGSCQSMRRDGRIARSAKN